MKLIVLSVIFGTYLSAAILIPDDKVPAYQRVKADAARLAKILRAKTTLKCRVEDGILIFETTRHDLKDRHEFAIDGIISCSIEDHRFEMEYREKGCGFSFRDSGLGFGAGFVAGVVACLVK